MIIPVIPYREDKNLGKAYNDEATKIEDRGWMCFHDYDTMFLTPDAISILNEYVRIAPSDTGFITCYTNRLHTLATGQLWEGKVSENTDIRYHMDVAEEVKKNLYSFTELTKNVSGFLLVVNKNVWNEIKFKEGVGCLGVDTQFVKDVIASGRKIYRADGLYVWHTYRLKNGVHDKTHLK